MMNVNAAFINLRPSPVVLNREGYLISEFRNRYK